MPLQTQTRTPQTTESYATEGRRHRKRADRTWPVVECPVERLAVSIEADLAILRPRTIRRYRAELSAALDALMGEDASREGAVEGVRLRIQAALNARKGTPPVARTSTRKVCDAAPEECETVLDDPHRRAVRTDADLLDALLPALVLAAPRVGVRPIEWRGARDRSDAHCGLRQAHERPRLRR